MTEQEIVNDACGLSESTSLAGLWLHVQDAITTGAMNGSKAYTMALVKRLRALGCIE